MHRTGMTKTPSSTGGFCRLFGVQNRSGAAHATPLHLKIKYYPRKNAFCTVRTNWSSSSLTKEILCFFYFV